MNNGLNNNGLNSSDFFSQFYDDSSFYSDNQASTSNQDDSVMNVEEPQWLSREDSSSKAPPFYFLNSLLLPHPLNVAAPMNWGPLPALPSLSPSSNQGQSQNRKRPFQHVSAEEVFYSLVEKKVGDTKGQIYKHVNRFFTQFIQSQFVRESCFLPFVYESFLKYNSRVVVALSTKDLRRFIHRFCDENRPYFEEADEEKWKLFTTFFSSDFALYHLFGKQKYTFKMSCKEALEEGGFLTGWNAPYLEKKGSKVYSEEEIKKKGLLTRRYLTLVNIATNQHLKMHGQLKYWKVTNISLLLEEKKKTELIQGWFTKEVVSLSAEECASRFLHFLKEKKICPSIEQEEQQELIEAIKEKNKALTFGFFIKQAHLLQSAYLSETFDAKIKEQIAENNEIPSLDQPTLSSAGVFKTRLLPKDLEDTISFCIGISVQKMKRGKIKFQFSLKFLVAVKEKSEWDFLYLEHIDKKDYKRLGAYIRKKIEAMEKKNLASFSTKEKGKACLFPILPSSEQLKKLSDDVIVSDLLILNCSIPHEYFEDSMDEESQKEWDVNQSDLIQKLSALSAAGLSVIFLGNVDSLAGGSQSISVSKLLENIKMSLAEDDFDLKSFQEEPDEDEEPSTSSSVRPVKLIDHDKLEKAFKKAQKNSLKALKVFLSSSLKKVAAREKKPLNQSEGPVEETALDKSKIFVDYTQLVQATCQLANEWDQLDQQIRQGITENAKYAPHPALTQYQEDFMRKALFWQEKNQGGVLADDMGLGKTVQALTVIQRLCPPKSPKKAPFLILCPQSTLDNWKRDAIHILKFEPENICVYHGPHRKTLALNDATIIVTTYETYCSDSANKQLAFSKLEWEGAVFDELHLFSNSKTRIERLQALGKDLKNRGKLRLALTGTPIQNKLSDLHAIWQVINPHSWGTVLQFNEYFINPLALANNHIGFLKTEKIDVKSDATAHLLLQQAAERLEELKLLFRHCFVRRLKTDEKIIAQIRQKLGTHLTVPNKIIRKVPFPLSAQQLEIYEQTIKKDEIQIIRTVAEAFFTTKKRGKNVDENESANLKLHLSTKDVKTGSNFLALRTKMCQMICHPLLAEKKGEELATAIDQLSLEALMEQSGKIKALMSLLQQLRQQEINQINGMIALIEKTLAIQDVERAYDWKDEPYWRAFVSSLTDIQKEKRKEILGVLNDLQKQVGAQSKSFLYNHEKKTTQHRLTFLDVWDHFMHSSLEEETLPKSMVEVYQTMNQVFFHQTNKILFFVQWRGMEYLLSKCLGEGFGEEIGFLSGEDDVKERVHLQNTFNSHISRNNLAIMLKAGGSGINLPKANKVFLLDLWFTSSAHNQAIDRARRLTSERPEIEVYEFTGVGTIEQKIISCAESKQEFIDFFFDEGPKNSSNWLMELFIKENDLAPEPNAQSTSSDSHSSEVVFNQDEGILEERGEPPMKKRRIVYHSNPASLLSNAAPSAPLSIFQSQSAMEDESEEDDEELRIAE
jgi:SNF2 family DNA or RNA helicase